MAVAAEGLAGAAAAAAVVLGGAAGTPGAAWAAPAAGPQEVVGELSFLPTSTSQVKDPKALLRYSLPIDNPPMRKAQAELESISQALRVPGVQFSAVKRSVGAARGVFKKEGKILQSVPSGRQAYVKGLVAEALKDLKDFDVIIDKQDIQNVPLQQQKVLNLVSQIEEAMMQDDAGQWKMPFEVPSLYSDVPQLKGRATLEMKVKIKDNLARGVDYDKVDMKIVADGLNAPVTAGNFVDLARRGFYDGMEIQRADGFVVQTGDPDVNDDQKNGFIGADGKTRTIPFEVRVRGDKEPIYEETMEDLGRANELPALPFNAYGTMAMARTEFEPNSASSQIFWLLKESELTPTGSNLLDGRYSVFGYITENEDSLGDLQVGDIIESVKVVDGLQNLQQPEGTAEAPAPTATPITP